MESAHCYSKVLRRWKDVIIDDISQEVNVFADYFRQNGIICEEQREEILEEQGTKKNKARKLFDHLIKKVTNFPHLYDAFIDILKEQQHNDLLQSLKDFESQDECQLGRAGIHRKALNKGHVMVDATESTRPQLHSKQFWKHSLYLVLNKLVVIPVIVIVTVAMTVTVMLKVLPIRVVTRGLGTNEGYRVEVTEVSWGSIDSNLMDRELEKMENMFFEGINPNDFPGGSSQWKAIDYKQTTEEVSTQFIPTGSQSENVTFISVTLNKTSRILVNETSDDHKPLQISAQWN